MTCSYNVVISLLFNGICFACSLDQDYNTGRIVKSVDWRQNAVPIIYVTGSHYEIGYAAGQTFGKMIQDFVETYEPLRGYLKMFETEQGKKIYDESLEATDSYFPQYLVELKGVADGANVPFHKLFLIHLDDILPSNVAGNSVDQGGTGCSTLMVNRPCRGQFIAHTEDALSATVNHFYIVSAHVKPSSEERGGRFGTREEKWEAITYAGSLSGYASGHNYHGLVYSINTIFAKRLLRGKIPRVFITRALLAAKADIDEIVDIVTNEGAGTADAFHVNVGFLDQTRCKRTFYSIEVVPSETQKISKVKVKSVPKGSVLFHTNKLQDGNLCEELKESGWQSSVAREKRYEELTSRRPVKSLKDIIRIMGDTEQGEWQIFRDRKDDFVNTINFGVFDFNEKTWTIWTNNPMTNSAMIKLPLKWTTFVSSTTEQEENTNRNTYFGNIMSSVTDIYKTGLETLGNMFF